MRTPVPYAASVVLACGLAVAACGTSGDGTDAPPGPSPGATATIEGNVESATGASAARRFLPGRLVAVARAQEAGQAGVRVSAAGTAISAETGADGSFALRGVPAGDIELRFEGGGAEAGLVLRGVPAGARVRLRNVRLLGDALAIDDIVVSEEEAARELLPWIARQPHSGVAPLTVAFEAAAWPAEREPFNFVWHFGDGSPGLPVEAGTHTFAAPGLYVVTLAATDAEDLRARAFTLVEVLGEPRPWEVTLEATPREGSAPLAVALRAALGAGAPPELAVLWDFGDGSEAAGESVAHTFASPGVYRVAVVSRSAAASVSDSIAIVVRGGATPTPMPTPTSTPGETPRPAATATTPAPTAIPSPGESPTPGPTTTPTLGPLPTGTPASTRTPSPTTTGTLTPAPSPTPSPAPATVEIRMQSDLTFSPADVTVPAGRTVRWVNEGPMRHNTISDTGLWSSRTQFPSDMRTGEVFSHTIPPETPPGSSLFYTCTLHGEPGDGTRLGIGMVGVIRVQ